MDFQEHMPDNVRVQLESQPVVPGYVMACKTHTQTRLTNPNSQTASDL
jgi:hypothetical protein